MSIVGQNIKFLRKKNGLTQDELANEMSVSRYKIGSYEESRATPKLSLLQLLAGYFKLSLDELVNQELWKEGQTSIQNDFANRARNLRVLTTVIDKDNRERFALVPQKASAGYTSGYSDPDYIEKLPVFDLPLPEFRNGGTYRVFQINGDSMSPIPSGSYIIGEYILGAVDISYGDCYIIVTKNEGIVYKRVEKEEDGQEKIRLNSDNPEYKSYTIRWDGILEMWKAVGFISTLLPQGQDLAASRIGHLIKGLQKELGKYNDKSTH